MPMNRQLDRPVILGIVGDSAAGKTTLAAGIAAVLGTDRVAVVRSDDYLRHGRKERLALGLSALNPAASHIDILEQHIQLLRAGRPLLKPVYDHGSGVLKPAEYVAPRDYVIVEGLHGFSTRTLRDCFDVKVFVEPEEDLRAAWRSQQDADAGPHPADSAAFIRPQRTFADMVVGFHRPKEQQNASGGRLNVRHTLRPTLPHPDLTPIIEGSKNGIRLELARDIDGKPVDVLEIAGDVGDRRAKAMEDLIWNLIPEASHLRAALGQYQDAQQQTRMSHPLALSQLLITYHLVKAAMGHYAI